MLNRLLAVLFPSVPRQLATRVTTQSPVVGARGRASAAGQSPEGGAGSSLDPVPFSGPPACETQVAFYPHPSRRWEFADERLGALVDRWKGARS